jgi:hypothetical protein
MSCESNDDCSKGEECRVLTDELSTCEIVVSTETDTAANKAEANFFSALVDMDQVSAELETTLPSPSVAPTTSKAYRETGATVFLAGDRESGKTQLLRSCFSEKDCTGNDICSTIENTNGLKVCHDASEDLAIETAKDLLDERFAVDPPSFDPPLGFVGTPAPTPVPTDLSQFEAFNVGTGVTTALVSCLASSDCTPDQACSAVSTTAPTKICHAAWELTGMVVLPVKASVAKPAAAAGIDTEANISGDDDAMLGRHSPTTKQPWYMGSECLPKLDELCGDHQYHTVDCPTCIHENKAELISEKICEGSMGHELVAAFCSTQVPTTAPTGTPTTIAPTAVPTTPTATPTKALPTAAPTMGTGFNELTSNLIIRGTSTAAFDQAMFKTLLVALLDERDHSAHLLSTAITLELSDIAAAPRPGRQRHLRRRLAGKILGVHIVMTVKVRVDISSGVQTELTNKVRS